MMNYIQKFNKFCYTDQYSFFDLMVIMILTMWIPTNFWLALLIVPAIMWSVHMRLLVSK